MTPGDPPCPHPAPAEEAVLHDGLLGIARAGGLEAAGRGEPRERDAVRADEPHTERHADLPHVSSRPPSTPPERRTRRNAPTSASWSASTIAGRAMMRTSQPGWN